MDPRTPAGPKVLAASAYPSGDAHTPVRTERRPKSTSPPAAFADAFSDAFLGPRVDQHLVVPEISRVELIDGREVIDVGSLPPHADAQALTGFLLAAHVLRAYVVATELLTRSSVDSDFASDVCIRKRGIDPETGARYLEELSFEIVNEQSMSDVTAKAKNLARRGVRRVFAIFVKSGEIREWSKTTGEFIRLDLNGTFDDPVFVRPMAVKALVDSTLAEAENEVAKALIAKKNPEILKLQEDAQQQGHKKGLDEGLDVGRNMLRSLSTQRFGDLPAVFKNRIDEATAEQLEDWTNRIFSAGSLEELFA